MSTLTIRNENNNAAILAAATTAALATVAAGAIGWRVLSSTSSNKNQKNDDIIPTVPGSWIPGIGVTPEYFSSMLLFMEKYFTKYQNENRSSSSAVFKATILGKTWYMVNDPKDVRKVFRSSESKLSFYMAIWLVGGNLMPKEEIDGKDASPEVKAIFRGHQFQGVSSTGFFVHALKQLPGWVPQLREAFQHNFQEQLNIEGTRDIFDWCLDLIGLATSRVMMGPDVDIEVVKVWTQIVKECDVESALTGKGLIGTIKSMVEIALTGERPIYRQARQFTYPYIDKEIERYLNDEPENTSVICSLVRVVGKRLNAKQHPQLLKEAKIRIANDLIFFTFAAITNSYGAAAWSLYHTLKNTKGCGDKIRSEIMATSNGNATSNDNSITVSDTLEMTILEITRLYTPANSYRYVKQSFQLESDPKIVIPEGTLVGTSYALTARRSEVYEHPCEFNPMRFDPSDTKSQECASNANFMGFGAGAHPCVGKRFALSEISIFVAEALKTFDFELVDDANGVKYDELCRANKNETKNEEAIGLTKRMIHGIDNHPILDPAQTNSIWRPIHPVMIKYKRKKTV